MKRMLTMLLLAASLPAMGNIVCEPSTPEKVKEWTTVNKGRPLNVVFFASWCLACVPSLKNAATEDSLFVAVFDKKPAAEEALQAMRREGRCVWDKDGAIARAYKVTSLPFSLKLPASSGSP